MTGWAIALPKQLPDGTFEIHASEDHLVAREARTFFLESRMPQVRAKDLELVYRAWAEGKITSWKDVADYMLPFEDDEIEKCGMELLDGDDDEPVWNDNDSCDSDDDPIDGLPAIPVSDTACASSVGSVPPVCEPSAAAALAARATCVPLEVALFFVCMRQ